MARLESMESEYNCTGGTGEALLFLIQRMPFGLIQHGYGLFMVQLAN